MMINFITDRYLGFQLPNIEFLYRNLNADDSLTIRLKVIHAPCPESEIKNSTTAVAADPEETSTSTAASPSEAVLKKTFQIPEKLIYGLLADKELSDFCLYSLGGGQPLECHKFILSARSPIFKKIISEGVDVKFEDISAKSLKQFMNFVYTRTFIEDENGYNENDESSWITALPEIAEMAVKVIHITEFNIN